MKLTHVVQERNGQMMKFRCRAMIWFGLGMLTFALGAFIFNSFFPLLRPEQGGIIDDWGEICVYQDVDGINLTISPKGCTSSTCTQIDQQVGIMVVDLQDRKISVDARFVLLETSRFPLPCTENCLGGERIRFVLSNLIPNDYMLWFGDQRVGEMSIFSGRSTPRQCFTNPQE